MGARSQGSKPNRAMSRPKVPGASGKEHPRDNLSTYKGCLRPSAHARTGPRFRGTAALDEAGAWIDPRKEVIGALRRFRKSKTQRIIPGTALIDDLRKRIDAQRLALSTCKAGALPAELRPHVLMSIVVPH
jgi:hypothetical protein